MRQATIVAPESVEMHQCPLPEPGAGQIRVRLEGCGVCASNLSVWEGRPWFDYPLEAGAPGHEGWGVVDALGSDVRQFSEGDRVAVLSYHAFAECDVADAAAAVRLPRSLEGIPFPGEPLGCALNIFYRAGIRQGQRVAVVGIGFLGALLVQLARAAGADVLAVSRRPWSLEVARRCGAEHTYLLTEPQEVLAQAEHVLRGAGCERVIEATGVQLALDMATALVAERGKLVVAGYHQDGTRQVNMQLWNWRGIDVINAHERDQQTYVRGMQAAVEAVLEGTLDFLPLMTHRYELHELATALRIARERPDGFMKSYVTCRSS